MEILGLDPKLMICKITVLPIKLYPLFSFILKPWLSYLISSFTIKKVINEMLSKKNLREC